MDHDGMGWAPLVDRSKRSLRKKSFNSARKNPISMLKKYPLKKDRGHDDFLKKLIKLQFFQDFFFFF